MENEKSLQVINENLLDSIIAETVQGSFGKGCDNMTCIILKFKK